jgi:hypothetical protein
MLATGLSPRSLRAFAAGAEAFDAERFFEAHEVWEDAWRLESGDARQLLHGLIQVAAAFHKGLAQENPRGMVRLLERGLGRLQALAAIAELEPFRGAVRCWLDEARAWAGGGSRPARPPPRLAGAVAQRPGSDSPQRS